MKNKGSLIVTDGNFDAVESSFTYLSNSNKYGLWATEYLGWKLISCVDSEGVQKT